jgi:hypothetical protein
MSYDLLRASPSLYILKLDSADLSYKPAPLVESRTR